MTPEEYQNYRKQVRDMLNEMAGVGDPNVGYFPRQNFDSRGVPRKPEPGWLGQINVQRGVAPSEVDVDKAMAAMGMARQPSALPIRPAAPAPASGGRNLTIKPAKASAPSEEDLVNQLFQDIQYQQERARQNTLRRFNDTLRGKSDLRDRVLQRIGNYGKYQAQINQEQADAELKNQKARLASRGLGNSSVFDAFSARNRRDLALEQQKLSEDVDNRAINNDIALTNSYFDTVASRNDNPPDMTPYINLAMQYGRGGGGKGYPQTAPNTPAPTPAPQAPQQSYSGTPMMGYSPVMAMQMSGLGNQFAGSLGSAVNAGLAPPAVFGGRRSIRSMQRFNQQQDPEMYATYLQLKQQFPGWGEG